MPPQPLLVSPHQASSACPCGSGERLERCCLPYLSGSSAAPTAESLMQSRYSAHVLLAIDYLWDTWDAAKRRRSSPQEIQSWASTCEWVGLEIIATEKGGAGDSEGLVSFIARFRQEGKLLEHREISLFRRIADRWVYVDHL